MGVLRRSLAGSWRLVSCLLPLAILSLMALPAQAQLIQQEDVSVEFDYFWPKSINKGYFPIRVYVESQSEDETEVQISVSADNWRGPAYCESTRTIAIEAGGKQSFELLVPGFLQGTSSSNFTAHVRVEGEHQSKVLDVSSNSQNSSIGTLLIITNKRNAPGLEDVLAEQMKTEDVQVSRFTSGATKPNVQVSFLAMDSIPTRYECFTSIDGVIVDLRHGYEPEQLGSLLAWARLGGRIVLIGKQELFEFEKVPGLEGAFEERFRIEQPTAMGDSDYTYRYGTGWIIPALRLDESLEGARLTGVTQRLLFADHPEDLTSWVPRRGTWRLAAETWQIPGIGEVPLRTFLFVLFLFGVLIGPVNFIFVRNANRPALFLITVPLLSLIASLGVLAYGILHQGVDTKTSSQTLTWLDQRTRRASTVEARTIYVGMSQAEGLTPGSGTCVLPALERGDDASYIVDSTESHVFEGSFLPVREPVGQMLLSDTPARLRLHAKKNGNRIEIENGLAQAMNGILLRGDHGGWYHSAERIEAGEKATLARLPDEDLFVPVQELMSGLEAEGFLLWRGRRLARSSFVTRLDSAPFADACGLEVNELQGTHLLVGVLNEAAEDWE